MESLTCELLSELQPGRAQSLRHTCQDHSTYLNLKCLCCDPPNQRSRGETTAAYSSRGIRLLRSAQSLRTITTKLRKLRSTAPCLGAVLEPSSGSLEPPFAATKHEPPFAARNPRVYAATLRSNGKPAAAEPSIAATKRGPFNHRSQSTCTGANLALGAAPLLGSDVQAPVRGSAAYMSPNGTAGGGASLSFSSVAASRDQAAKFHVHSK